jgi:hypothetical protein
LIAIAKGTLIRNYVHHSWKEMAGSDRHNWILGIRIVLIVSNIHCNALLVLLPP